MNNNLFGTDGIRRKVGDHPLTLESTIILGRAIARWAQTKYNNKPTMLIGHDTRESCDFLKSALKTGLLLHSVTIYDAHVLPTPAVFNIIHREKKFDCGIVISASHNPYQDNGIKIMDAENGKLSLDDEHAISCLFQQYQQEKQTHKYKSLGSDFTWNKAEQQYSNDVIKHFDRDLLQGRTVVLDCANGATSTVAPHIFKQLGAQVIALHHCPTGVNINNKCGSVFPQDLQRTILKHNADIGFAFDGDGDRITMVNKKGEVKDGDDILALLTTSHPLYKKDTAVVGTVMTNKGLELFLHKQHKTLIRTSVGDKFVAKVLSQKQLLLGGEQSGHIIAHDYLNIGDGIFAALRVIQAIKKTNNWELTTFKKYPQVTISVPIKEKKDLNNAPLAAIIAASKKQLKAGRLLVRYSGTECILRVMVEEETHDDAHYLCTNLSQKLQKELS